jgi:hypothetical protein
MQTPCDCEQQLQLVGRMAGSKRGDEFRSGDLVS